MNIEIVEVELAPEEWTKHEEIVKMMQIYQDEIGCDSDAIILRRYKGTNFCQLNYRGWEGWETIGNLFEVKE